jgi:hypothetical protein
MREDELLNSPQQVALNPTNMLRLSLVNEYETVSVCVFWLFFKDKPLSKKQPPATVFEYLRLPNSFFSQLMKVINNKIGINIFIIRLGLGSH